MSDILEKEIDLENIDTEETKIKVVKPKSYITINESLRIRIEDENLILEELIGDKEKDNWGNNKYFTTWTGVINKLIRKEATVKISAKEINTLKEASAEWIKASNEVKKILLTEIENSVKGVSDEVKVKIKKFLG
jgi:hypothetical protein